MNNNNINISGILNKMQTKLDSSNLVQYYFVLDNKAVVCLNDFLDREIIIELSGIIKCNHCHKKTKKSYSNGYCYYCAIKLARCDLCMVKPNNCHFHLGTCREPNWALNYCFSPHVVYLANSSGLKVGIAKLSNLPTRWIDQGAIQAIPVIKTSSRYQAGLIEVMFANKIKDKTNWRKMLADNNEIIDLIEHKNILLRDYCLELEQYKSQNKIEILEDNNILEIIYPKLQNKINKIKLTSLNKNSLIKDILLGIKGQYLILSEGVVNLRNLTGFEVRLQF